MTRQPCLDHPDPVTAAVPPAAVEPPAPATSRKEIIMTRQSVLYNIFHPVLPPEGPPPEGPGRERELLTGHCIRCGAVGTHYLTCPSLRLPSGYRLIDDPGPECRCGLPAGSCGVCGQMTAAAVRPSSRASNR